MFVGVRSLELCSSSFESLPSGRANPDAELLRGRGIDTHPVSSDGLSIR